MTAGRVINQDTYPIEKSWLIKSFVYVVIVTIFIAGFVFLSELSKRHEIGLRYGTVVTIMLALQFGSFIVLILRRNRFKYEFGEKNIIIKQGVLSKSERQVFYGRIQNIGVSQDLIDRLFGIASLVIETASDAGGAVVINDQDRSIDPAGILAALGSNSNYIAIPGLSYQNATELKNYVMEQIKANPIDDAQSGL